MLPLSARGVVVGVGVEVGTGTAVEVGVGVGLEQANTEASTRKIAQDKTFNIKASLPLRLGNFHLVERGCHSTDCISGHQDGSVKSQGALGVASSERGRGAARDLSALSI